VSNAFVRAALLARLSKMKSIVRKVQACTGEALIGATGRALDAITSEDIRGFYAEGGYRLPSLQSL